MSGLPPDDGDPDHPRLQLLLAPRQHRRGPAPHPPHARPRASQASPPRRGHHGPRARPRAARPASPREQLEAFFATALCVPVLTAHPTEVRRQSIDRPRDGDRRLLDERDRVAAHARGAGAQSQEALRRTVLTLWQTSLLRHTRLRVLDEVANGARLLRLHLPARAAASSTRSSLRGPARPAELPSFLRMGSWIGGDRDGNPFVTAEVLRQALAMQSQRALRFYLERAASAGRRAAARRPHGRGLRRAAGAGRRARPTRRPSARTSPTAARSPASMRGSPRPRGRSTSSRRRIRRSGEAPAYADGGRAEGRPRHASTTRSTRQQSRRPGARPAAGAAPRGRRVRLPSRRARHAPELRRARARRWPSCWRRPAPAPDYAALDEAARVGAAVGRARQPAAARDAASCLLARRPPTSSPCCGPRRDAHRRYGAAVVPHYVISKADSVSDILEVAVLLKEVGLLRPRERPLDVDIVPLFETIADLQHCGADHGRRCSPCRPIAAWSTARGGCRR